MFEMTLYTTVYHKMIVYFKILIVQLQVFKTII